LEFLFPHNEMSILGVQSRKETFTHSITKDVEINRNMHK